MSLFNSIADLRRGGAGAQKAYLGSTLVWESPSAPAPESPPSDYRDLIVSDSPSAYWRLGEASGTAAADEMGNHPATYQNGTSLGFAGALSGDADTSVSNGTSDAVMSVPDADIFSPAAGVVTYEGWFKDPSNNVSIFQKHATNNSEFLFQWSSTTSSLRFTAYDLASQNFAYDISTPNNSFASTGWHHVVLVIDHANSTASIYINGTLQASGTRTAAMGNGTAPLLVGQGGGLSADEVAVYPRALTATDVERHYSMGTTGELPALPPTGGYLVYDDFNRADNTTGLGTSTSGHAWSSSHGGTWGITNNQAYWVSGGSGPSTYDTIISIDSGVADCTVSVDVMAGTDTWGGVVFREASGSNFWMVFINDQNQITLYKVVSGGFTKVGNDVVLPAATAGTFQTLTVGLSGSSITVSVDGTQHITVTDTAHQAATKHGLYMSKQWIATRFDNFGVMGPVTPGTPGSAPLALWKFDEASGASTAVDELSTYTGSYSNTFISGGTGHLGKAAEFGPNRYVSVSPDLPAPGVGDFSIEFWVNLSGVTDTTGFFNIGDPQNADNISVFINSSHSLVFRTVNGNYVSGRHHVFADFASYLDGAWHHVVCTREDGVKSVYIDGTLVANGYATQDLSPSGSFRIGQFVFGGSFKSWSDVGHLDEMSYYSFALTPENVAAHHGGDVWVAPIAPIAGGTISDIGGYRYHVFTADETLEVFDPVDVEYLLVGGGGGGGYSSTAYVGGGGGAGGLLQGSFSLTPGEYPVTIGSGGAGGTGLASTIANNGQNGENSTFNGLTAIGGGGGGSTNNGTSTTNTAGKSGGSGGGGGYQGGGGGAGTSGQGYAGWGPTGSNAGYGGCGGGAGGAAIAGSGSQGTPGPGVTWLDGIEYAKGGSGFPTTMRVNKGDGGWANYTNGTAQNGLPGSDGVLVVRYPYGTASGGVVTEDADYRYHTFSADGSLVVQDGFLPADILLVGGGGGGGHAGTNAYIAAGGGGGGGVIEVLSHELAPGTYPVIVGTGGVGGAGTSEAANGGDSSLDNLTAIGGGRGRGYNGAYYSVGSGGSGGGGYAAYSTDGPTPSGAGTAGQGFEGGDGYSVNNSTGWRSGGGGGAGAAGPDASTMSAGVGAPGGSGKASSLSGASVTYGGGGGGTGSSSGGSGGTGGGGAGARNAHATAGAANTGGGGGGASGNGYNGGAGGSGLVVVRYPKHPPPPPAEYVDFATHVNTSNVTSGAVTLPATAQEGDLLVVWVDWDASGALDINGPAGWTRHAHDARGSAPGSGHGAIFSKVVEASDTPGSTSYTFTQTVASGNVHIGLVVFRNAAEVVSCNQAMDGWNTNTYTQSTSAASRALVFFSYKDGSYTLTWPASMTGIYNLANGTGGSDTVAAAIEVADNPSGTSRTVTWGTVGSSHIGGFLVGVS